MSKKDMIKTCLVLGEGMLLAEEAVSNVVERPSTIALHLLAGDFYYVRIG